jgi:hypothetical protein
MDKYKNLPIYDSYIELLKSKKNALIYECETCKYYTLNGNNYKRHILNAKHLNGGGILNKEEIYECKECKYLSKIKNNYQRHLKSKKHLNEGKNVKRTEEKKYECIECNFTSKINKNYQNHIISKKHINHLIYQKE